MTMEGDSNLSESEGLLHSIIEKNRQLKRLLSGEEKCDEQHLLQQIIALSRDQSSFLLENCSTWREMLQVSLETVSYETSPQHQTDEENASWKEFRFGDTMCSVLEDLSGIERFLQNIHRKLDSAAHVASDSEEADQPSQDLEMMHSLQPDGLEHGPPQNQEDPVGPQNLFQDSNSHGAPGSNLMKTPAVSSYDANQRPVDNEMTSLPADADNRDVLDEVAPDMGAGDVAVADVNSQKEDVPGAGVTDAGTEAGVSGCDRREQPRIERSDGLVTRALSGQSAPGTSKDPNLCYVTAPGVIGQLMTCEEVNSASSRVVCEAEELVSRVLRIQTPEPLRAFCPVTIAIPFTSRHRGSYRDILVKVFDKDERSSYITPTSIEGVYGGKRGSFAEVKVYKLGLFAVVSCLRRESFTVPRKGLSLKLSMDSRICFDYFPGTFSSPVVVQSMV